MKNRIEWVDAAKALGITLVVYGHVILGIHDANIWENTINYQFQHSVVYTMHMPLFFFLSGLFAKKWVIRNPKIAISQKIRSLIYPYFIWGFIQAGIMQIFSKNTNNGQGITNALQLPFIPYAQFWFLYDLFWIFIIYYVLKHILKITDKILLLGGTVLFIISPLLDFWESSRIAYYAIFFIVGTTIVNNISLLNRINMYVKVTIFLVLNIVYFLLVMRKQELLLVNFMSIFVAAIGIIIIIAIASRTHIAWIDYIGRNSIVIYVAHIIFTAGTRILLLKIGIINVPIHIIIGLIIGIVAPIITQKIAQKIKISRYIFQE